MNGFFIFLFTVNGFFSVIKDLINHRANSPETLFLFILVALFSIARQIERVADKNNNENEE